MELPDVGVKRYKVVDPKSVGKKLREQVSKTESILMDAAEIRSQVEEQPKIELFQGIEGAKRIFDLVIKDNQKN